MLRRAPGRIDLPCQTLCEAVYDCLRPLINPSEKMRRSLTPPYQFTLPVHDHKCPSGVFGVGVLFTCSIFNQWRTSPTSFLREEERMKNFFSAHDVKYRHFQYYLISRWVCFFFRNAHQYSTVNSKSVFIRRGIPKPSSQKQKTLQTKGQNASTTHTKIGTRWDGKRTNIPWKASKRSSCAILSRKTYASSIKSPWSG